MWHTHSRGFVLCQRHLSIEQTLSRWREWPGIPQRVESKGGEDIQQHTDLTKKGLQDRGSLETAQPKRDGKELWATYLCPATYVCFRKKKKKKL